MAYIVCISYNIYIIYVQHLRHLHQLPANYITCVTHIMYRWLTSIVSYKTSKYNVIVAGLDL